MSFPDLFFRKVDQSDDQGAVSAASPAAAAAVAFDACLAPQIRMVPGHLVIGMGWIVGPFTRLVLFAGVRQVITQPSLLILLASTRDDFV